VRALRRASWLVAIVALGACSGDSSSTNDTSAASESVVDSQVSSSTNAPVGGVDGLPVVAVTYSALESVVAGIVGDSARVEVIIPNGTDPHDFEPSAKDVEMMSSSAIVVANGLDLEEGLEDALAETEKSGVPVFHVADHVTLRKGSDHATKHTATKNTATKRTATKNTATKRTATKNTATKSTATKSTVTALRTRTSGSTHSRLPRQCQRWPNKLVR